MKKADISGANFAIIIGDSEMTKKRVSLKSLRGAKVGKAEQQQELSVIDAIRKVRESDV